MDFLADDQVDSEVVLGVEEVDEGEELNEAKESTMLNLYTNQILPLSKKKQRLKQKK